MGGKKYTRAETRKIWKYRALAARVRKHRQQRLATGKKPDLSYKAEQGAIMSHVLVSLAGKYEPDLRVRI